MPSSAHNSWVQESKLYIRARRRIHTITPMGGDFICVICGSHFSFRAPRFCSKYTRPVAIKRPTSPCNRHNRHPTATLAASPQCQPARLGGALMITGSSTLERAIRMKLTILDNVEQLRDRAAEWDDLWRRSEVALPTTRAPLVALWINHFAPLPPLNLAKRYVIVSTYALGSPAAHKRFAKLAHAYVAKLHGLLKGMLNEESLFFFATPACSPPGWLCAQRAYPSANCHNSGAGRYRRRPERHQSLFISQDNRVESQHRDRQSRHGSLLCFSPSRQF